MKKPITAASLFLLLLSVVLLSVQPAESHLSQFTGGTGGPFKDRWMGGVTWVANNSTVGANITGSRTALQVVQTAFNTWLSPQSAPNLNLANLPVTQNTAGTTISRAGSDGTNLICFTCTDNAFNTPGILAITFTTTNTGGQITDADILFNPAVTFTTNPTGSTDPANIFDLQTVATHEIGHFFGLDHSAVVRAIMFPFAPPLETTLSMDDIAGMAAVYPKITPDVPTGSISGTVTFAGSNVAVFGAHVFAESTTNANAFANFPLVRKSPIGILTLPTGAYTIPGLPADSYIVTAEPLDAPVTNDNVANYPVVFGQPFVQTPFTTRSH